MKVFKFGGASMKDATAVKNVCDIIGAYPNQKLIVVVSAIGKTTNQFEELVSAYYSNDELRYKDSLNNIKQFHFEIINQLQIESSESLLNDLNDVFEHLSRLFSHPKVENRPYQYDQVVSFGEFLSCKILTSYLISTGIKATWLDARKLIRTDSSYQNGQIDWETTITLCKQSLLPLFEHVDLTITQGFIGHTAEGHTTTLGREGSDYSAGILAYCCNAEDVTIWKDVPGMLNADPKFFKDTKLLESISYNEAIELSYYGASVIHPKTVQPLQQKNIPLFVKSFLNPKAQGTIISSDAHRDSQIPSYIVKFDQVLVTISPKDFSFIAEKQLTDIFEALSKMQVTINLMQNSAVNFSILIDRNKIDLDQLNLQLSNLYHIKYNENLELVTIRHFNERIIEEMKGEKLCLLEQKTRTTARFVLGNIN